MVQRLARSGALVLALLTPSACSVVGGNKTRAPRPAAASQQQESQARKNGPRPYRQVIPATARSDSGMFTVHTVDDKLFYEIPKSMIDKEMLIVSRIAKTASEIGYGGEQYNRQVVRWQLNGDKVLLRSRQYSVVADDTLPIARAVEASHFEPILRALPIAAYSPDSSAVVVEATELYTKDIPVFGLDSRSRERYKVRRMDDSRAYVVSAKSFPRNVEVRHVLTYEASQPPTNASTGTISVEMNQSMVLLPENPMRPRFYDERVGYFGSRRTNYGLDAHRAEEQRIISRWRLEPSDTAAFLRGERVEPVKPIVYYIDPATPMRWRACLKRGVEDWNVAFAEAGFRNAIQAKDPPSPEEDPEFSPEDARYSVIRYFSSDVQNAYGPHVADPRTGEILESDIGWYHNVMNLLRNWYLIQTAAVNPEARRARFDDDVMCELVRFVAAHEVGHTLGLPHNMKASAAYPVDSLRSASFTKKYGTAPSIMDYARFNYVAQPGDEGVGFMPGIGVYDRYAIRWGYRPILEAETAEAEKATLHAWIKAHEGDPMYMFGDATGLDPHAQTEAIGDDPVRASDYGIRNLKRILPELPAWTYEEGKDYSDLEELYGQVIGQWSRYMGHVATVIGGVHETRKTMDQQGAVYAPVAEAEQRRALGFLVDQAIRTPEWMIDNDILLRIGNPSAVEQIRSRQAGVVDNILEPQRMIRLIEAEAVLGARAYTLGEMLGDLRAGVWTELRSGRPIDLYRRNVQRAYVDRMGYLINYEPPRPVSAPFGTFRPAAANVQESDIPAFARGELVGLQREIRGALGRTGDRATRLHLQDIQARIDEILDPNG